MKKLTYGVTSILLVCAASNAHAQVYVGGDIMVGNAGGNDPAPQNTSNTYNSTESNSIFDGNYGATVPEETVPQAPMPETQSQNTTPNPGGASSLPYETVPQTSAPETYSQNNPQNSANTPSVASADPQTQSAKTSKVSTKKYASNDKKITKNVRDRFEEFEFLNPEYLNLDTKNGDLTAEGYVYNDLEFEQGYLLASTTPGVKKVNFQQVSVGNTITSYEDREINARAKTHLYKNGLVDNDNILEWPINTETNDGVVYINGKVADEDTRNDLAHALYDVDGVNRVMVHKDLY